MSLVLIIYMTLVQNFETNWYQFDITVIYLEYQKKKKKKKLFVLIRQPSLAS
jgi:hypothetical protein